jgi:ABC-type oligopeptide transport system ATPase subunit
MTEVLLSAEDLVVAFKDAHHARGVNVAVDGVSLQIGKGEIFGLVGESGSGKTTLGKTLLRLNEPRAGRIRLDGVDLTHLSEGQLRPYRRRMQMVFQDPLSSFNPRRTIGQAIADPMRLHRLHPRAGIGAEVARVLADVGLPESFASRYPHQMSGGQLQRAAIGRALALDPDIIIADEAVSKLDVSVRAQVLNLLRTIHARRGLSLLFITHDLHVARYLCHRIGVMRAGRLLECGPTAEVFARPRDDYTRTLLGTISRPALAKQEVCP